MQLAALIIASFSALLSLIIVIMIRRDRSSPVPDDRLRELREGLANTQQVINARLDSATRETNATLTHLTTQLTEGVNRTREDNRTLLEQRLGDVQSRLDARFTDIQSALNHDLLQNRQELSAALDSSTKALQSRFDTLQQSNELKLESIRENVEQKLTATLDQNLGAVRHMMEQLGDLKATNERIVEISQDINKLSDILQAPKLRGQFGEFQLESLLRQVIPLERLSLQHPLGNGFIVDAAIELKEGLLCIDSKFPKSAFDRLTEANLTEDERLRLGREFEKDVRMHVDSIAVKYIVPDRTLDFALMFVPAENIYYEMLMRPELQEYMRSRHVVPASPNSLYAYLAVISIGFRGMRIEQEAKRIEGILLTLKKQFDDFKQHFKLIGTHLDRARSQFDNATREVNRFDTTIGDLHGGAAQLRSLPGDEAEAPTGEGNLFAEAGDEQP